MNEKLKGLAWGVLGLFVFVTAALFAYSNLTLLCPSCNDVIEIFSGLLEDEEARRAQNILMFQRSQLESDNPQVQTAEGTTRGMVMHGVVMPTIELTAVAEFNNRTPTPGPTSPAFWERPGAEKTAVASCPEGTFSSSIVTPPPTPVHWTPVPHEGDYAEFLWAIAQQKREYGISGQTVEEFVLRYPHGLVMCAGPAPSSGFMSDMPGFSIGAVTPEPRGVYFSDLVPTVTPTPLPK